MAKVFGVPLAEVMERPNERTIPTFVKTVIRYLNANAIDTEVIFRIAPKIKALNVIKEKIDAGEEVDYAEYRDPHLVANLLKTYLRELPNPLLTFGLYPKFVDAATEYETALNLQRARSSSGFNEPTEVHVDKYITALSGLVDELPAANKALAEILLLFLSRVGEHSSKNKMTPANLAIVFGEILLRPEVETVESMMNAAKITSIMRFMIENFEKIFPKQRPRPTKGSKAAPAGETKKNEEQEKLQRIKDTVDDAIVLVQKKLHSLSHQLSETEQLDVAIDIARRVRTAKKVLFPPGEEPKSRRGPRSRPCGFVLKSGCAERQGKRKTMEDASVLIDDLKSEFEFPESRGNETWAFYAVYDGHGGSETSKICSELLHKNLFNNPKLLEGDIVEAYREAYEQTDQYALKKGEEQGTKDGSTAVTVVINNNTLHIANAGDSEAVLCRVKSDGSIVAQVISEIHRPTTAEEKTRIEKAGGAVFSGRVFGALAVSRSLGDGDFKIPTSEANFVTSEPFVNTIELTNECSFLLLACDGLFDKLSPQEACEFVHEQLQENALQDVAELLAEYALTKQTTDNVSVVLCQFAWK